ncbi:hypothetical protein AEAC466_19710 [Asticcacaulis sp. AC466]|uniref:nucleotidyltransferase family protein n=1 Tax=Asticcacaulis sp. AC466 TaxID=1282362 RepID=UPI0003C3FF28|nr:nucleotidyltransferase family protein [Asticcacaulis sp. AC466]ESQ81958.1 hypothetical protein AEAC466_19710 [Asticcacaulis sp. AC466]
MSPQTAFILAAGLGTRMRPLTDDRPKALVEVAGRPLIDHMLDRLKAAGANRFVVNVHYFADRLEAHLKARSDIDIIVSDEREALLETGGGLKKARPLLGDDPIWVANIDSVWLEAAPDGTALQALANQWNAAEMDAALLVTAMETSHGFDGAGDFFLAKDGRLSFRGDAPSAPFNYMGVHITRPAIIDTELDAAFSLSRIWRRIAPQGRLFGTEFTGEWMHVGDPAARDFADGRLNS